MTPKEFYDLPENVQDILATFDEDESLYKECKRVRQELNAINFECDYDLSGEIFDVKPMKPKKFLFNNTLIKIRYNKKFKTFEALTATIDPRANEKIQNLGNDWNCFGASIQETETKIKRILSEGNNETIIL